MRGGDCVDIWTYRGTKAFGINEHALMVAEQTALHWDVCGLSRAAALENRFCCCGW
jgi:hypothetical protein